MKHVSMAVIALGLWCNAFAQKQNSTITKSPAYWKQYYDDREKSAPADVQQQLKELREKGVKEKWTFEIGYTGVYNTDLRYLTGFKEPTEAFSRAHPEMVTPAEKYTKMQPQPNIKKLNIGTASMPYFDGRTLGIVTPSRNQYSLCGSCWAFAAVAAFETSCLLKNGGDPASMDLSEQQVLDCSIPFGCGGEAVSVGVSYIAGHFIQPESVYPYTGSSVACREFGNSPYPGRCWGWVGGSIFSATFASVNDIKQAICDHGSVISAYYVSTLFRMYRGIGVYNHEDNGVASNHVVQIIGWDDLRGAWLIKNSWGPDAWGEDGFGWVAYNSNHIGGYSCWVDAEAVPAQNTAAAVLSVAEPVLPLAYDYTHNLPASDIYRIQNVQSGKLVEVKDGCDLFDKGSKVQQYESHGPVVCCDGKNQEWLFIPAGMVNGRPAFYIINNGFMKTLEPGAHPTVQENSQVDARWYITPFGDYFYLSSVATGLYLEVPPGNPNNSEWMQMSAFNGNQNQQFRFNKDVGLTGPQQEYTSGSYVNICTAINDSKVLNIASASAGNGTAIQLYDVQRNSPNEMWRLERTPDGYYRFISPVGPGKCIDVAWWDASNTNNLVSWDRADVEKQKWLIIPVVREPGSYVFFNKVSGNCMDLESGITDNHRVIQTYRYVGRNNQKWKLLQVR
ncbi:MAG: RICIN domain-containing protein [Chitinophagaceae bacterium]